jgi:mono/diheme cytochrome c family protein
MRIETLGSVWLALVMLVVFAAAAVFGQEASRRTLRDGVYSDARATAGRRLYDAQCAGCHDGGSMGPELKGDDFLATWENKTLRVLYTRVQETMPSDAPGTLQEQELLDLMAYLVRANGFAPGATGFSAPADLDTITIVRSK